MRKIQPTIAGSEDGARGPKAKECVWSLEPRKSEETNPLEPPERV